jgi:hypothetical protein
LLKWLLTRHTIENCQEKQKIASIFQSKETKTYRGDYFNIKHSFSCSDSNNTWGGSLLVIDNKIHEIKPSQNIVIGWLK